ncbi:MAG: amidohydrolase family protein, partial [Gammaproteobacteria bacterium]|nr:amidohydrolase family protein [Gammaproteobacteria bacterium]
MQNPRLPTNGQAPRAGRNLVAFRRTRPYPWAHEGATAYRTGLAECGGRDDHAHLPVHGQPGVSLSWLANRPEACRDLHPASPRSAIGPSGWVDFRCSPTHRPSMDELIIRNGSVIDGLTPARTTRTIAVSGSRIHPLEQLDNPDTADTIDAEHLVVAPGFIDVHTHDDRLVMSDPTMTPKVSQGVTTVITGNCGVSLAPLCGVEPPPPLNLLGDSNDFRYSTMLEYRDAVERFPPAINLAMQVGHSTLRAATMDDLERPATADEIGRMGELLDAAMAAGAIGMSTGLAYAPAAHAPTEEVIALVSRLKAHNGI